MTKPQPQYPGLYYHIFSRGNNRENIFIEERNYPYFLKLYAIHIEPVVETFAWCLMRNHFHLLVRIKEFDNPKSANDRDYSSYNACPSDKLTRLKRVEMLEWFGGPDGFEQFHRQTESDAKIKKLVEEDS